MEPIYPNVTVKLTGHDGNAFAVLGAVHKALRRAGLTSAVIAEFNKEACAGDYDHLLQTCLKWVRVK